MPVVTPLDAAPSLEVFPSVIYLGLEVAGVWSLGLVALIQIQPFVIVRPALYWYVFGGAIGGVRV